MTSAGQEQQAVAIDQDPALDEKSSARSRVLSQFERYTAVYGIVILVAVFGLTNTRLFLTQTTLSVVLSENSIAAIVALGLLVPVACGAFDLSIGGTVGACAMLVTWLQVHGWSLGLSIVVTLLAGIAIGLANGIVVVGLRVNSFIATLGMSSVLTAITEWISGGQTITAVSSSAFSSLGNATPVPDVSIVAIYLVVIAALLWWLLERTPIGRNLYAVGGNQTAAKLAGIRTSHYIATAFIASALLGSIAGVAFAAKVGSASTATGPAYLLPAFAGVFLGATQVRPGRVNVLGTLVAIFLLAVGVAGLQLAGAPGWVSDLFNGLAVIVAVALSNLRRRSRLHVNA